MFTVLNPNKRKILTKKKRKNTHQQNNSEAEQSKIILKNKAKILESHTWKNKAAPRFKGP